MDLSARKVLLADDFIRELHMDEYVQATYEKSVAETPGLAEDTPEEARRREIAWLNLKWFMQTLLDRMDRTSMHSGLEARVPFCGPPHCGIFVECAMGHENKEMVWQSIF